MRRTKTVIFLGAGASAAEGAPMQNSLFKAFFSSAKIHNTTNDSLKQIQKELARFFESAFDIKVQGNLDSTVFPTFEEALGILDLSDLRGESLRFFGGDEQSVDGSLSGGARIRLVRFYLVMSMAKAIADALRRRRTQDSPHRKLVTSLKSEGLMGETAFISANYDLLIDNALRYGADYERASVDYGVDFDWPRDYLDEVEGYKGDRVPLLKIHGSLNWMHCPTCNGLKLFEEKIVENLLGNTGRAKCDHCGFIMSPVIVPPTFFKDMSKAFLGAIWHRAENVLREATRIIFCGYSFPDADMHIKYLLKRVQTNRSNPRALRFTVVNNHPGKSEEQKAAERERFQRFLGKINYTEHSFEEFAAGPRSFYAA